MIPNRLTKIDDLTRPNHYFLDDDDECYYLGEYTAGEGYKHSETNQLIYNLKKPLKYRNQSPWKYKIDAINEVGAAFRKSIKQDTLVNNCTLVPIPPSKKKSDPEYDDRIVQILYAMDKHHKLDIRELVKQRQSIVPAHESEDGERATIEELLTLYEIDESLSKPPPNKILVFDDLLTTGRHFKAMKAVLQNQFPDTRIIGIFVARRELKTNNVADINLDEFFD